MWGMAVHSRVVLTSLAMHPQATQAWATVLVLLQAMAAALPRLVQAATVALVVRKTQALQPGLVAHRLDVAVAVDFLEGAWVGAVAQLRQIPRPAQVHRQFPRRRRLRFGNNRLADIVRPARPMVRGKKPAC